MLGDGSKCLAPSDQFPLTTKADDAQTILESPGISFSEYARELRYIYIYIYCMYHIYSYIIGQEFQPKLWSATRILLAPKIGCFLRTTIAPFSGHLLPHFLDPCQHRTFPFLRGKFRAFKVKPSLRFPIHQQLFEIDAPSHHRVYKGHNGFYTQFNQLYIQYIYIYIHLLFIKVPCCLNHVMGFLMTSSTLNLDSHKLKSTGAWHNNVWIPGGKNPQWSATFRLWFQGLNHGAHRMLGNVLGQIWTPWPRNHCF